jgi:uncharacterized protein (DUF58 family)
MAVLAENSADAVSVSVQSLVALHTEVAGISLLPKRIGAQTAGNYLSRLKGRGMEFAESRPYEPGDDARNLHWRVMARTGKPFTKQFREERERPVLVWVDLRSRMFFGTRVALKAVVAARCAALIAWAANRIGDRIGGVIFSDRIHHEIKPVRGKAAVLFLLKMLVEHPAWTERKQGQPGHSAREAMIRLRRVVRPGSRVILLSDFANFDAAMENNLAQLARHNEITLLHIYDALEASLPPPGRYRLSDGADEFVIDTADPRYRTNYAEKFAAHVAHLRSFARRHRISYLSCRTDQDPVSVLRKELGAQQGI